MAYQYYQRAVSAWGRGGKVHLGTPPIPNIHPQPDWNGQDYFISHSVNPDMSLIYPLLDLVHDTRGRGGFDASDAKTWHREIYGGATQLTRALPSDIGAAAAYEAYRGWKHHRRTLYDCLQNDRERQVEAMVGLAVAEVTHLWQWTGRPMDRAGMQEALQVAALTVANIAYRALEGGLRFFGGGAASSRRSSVSSLVDDGYVRHRRRSSFGGTAPMITSHSAYGTPYTTQMPLAGGSPYAQPMSISSHSSPIPIPVQGSGYGAGVAVSSGSYHGGHGRSYSGSSYQPGIIQSSPYRGATVLPPGAGSYAGSAGYVTQPQYATSGYAGAGQTYTIQGSSIPGGAMTIPNVLPGSTIIINQPSKRSSRRSSVSTSKPSSYHRSRSSDPSKRVAFL